MQARARGLELLAQDVAVTEAAVKITENVE